jgi:hypothetical protein
VALPSRRCRHCGDPIEYRANMIVPAWVHLWTGSIYCDLGARLQAEPR